MPDNYILLVEDNPDDAKLTLRALRKNAILHHVVVVEDGVEALDYLFSRGRFTGRNPSRLPQLILLDLKMPKLTGQEVLHSIRTHTETSHLPVIILTTSNEKGDEVDSYNRGADCYILKTVDFHQFQQSMAALKAVLDDLKQYAMDKK